MVDRITKIEEEMRENPGGVKFNDLRKVCDHHFGEPRNQGSSHYIYKMPWPGNPRVNIQTAKGNAKTYQVKQAITAIDKLREGNR